MPANIKLISCLLTNFSWQVLVFLFLSLLFSTPSFSFSAPEAKKVLFFSAGGSNGIYHSLADNICILFNQSTKNSVVCKVLQSSGSDENLTNLQNSTASLALVQPLSLLAAQKNELNNISIISKLNKEDYVLLVRKNDLSIQNLYGLKSKKLNMSENGSGLHLAITFLLAAANLTEKDIKAGATVSASMQGELLCDGTIDAALYVASTPNALVYQALETCELRALPINGDEAQKIMDRPKVFFEKSVLEGGNYPGIYQNIDTITERVLLLARTDIGEEVISGLLEVIKANLEQLKALHPAFSSIEKDLLVPETAYNRDN